MRKIIFAWVMLLVTVAASAQMQPGAVPADFLGKTPHGDVVSLASMRDKVVVISFWATWCGYCMKELPILAGLQTLATQRHLPLQVVSIDHREARDVFIRTARALRPVGADRQAVRHQQGHSGDGDDSSRRHRGRRARGLQRRCAGRSSGRDQYPDGRAFRAARIERVCRAKNAYLGALSGWAARRNGSRKIRTSQTLSVRSRTGSLDRLTA
jgi:hypothetical protein